MPLGDLAQTFAYGYQQSIGRHGFHWLMAAGSVSIVSGVALAIIGAISFAFGDITGGVWVCSLPLLR